MSALIEGINGMPVNMIRHIPFEFYVDEHITLMACRFTALEVVLGESGMGVREVRRRVPTLCYYSTGGGAGREQDGGEGG